MNVKRSAGFLREALRDLRLAWRLFRDGRVSWGAKAVPLLAAAYLLWPMDLLADPIIGLGQADDLAVLLMGVNLFIRLCPQDLVQRYRQGSSRRERGRDEPIDGVYRVLEEQFEG